ncbi:dipeptide epimerase [Pacificimonas sp. WHA3]|uniref:Dipeptide epimerase n=1 Tax=Pacificimonas pallii TaxID=2827236 RepID=A0ABS6SGC8_9SPHN|nr:N-acetyl-D-Glu racemase DgcA [Pacificimonas pallii]MBV7256892.1 dipeptide epimerase [Pacificimonas pallii]
MPQPILSVRIERFPTDGAFTISRGAKTHVDVVVAEITIGNIVGRGEATPIYYRGETAEGVATDLFQLATAVAGGITREDLLKTLPAGAARNALDAALWDTEAKLTGRRVWERIGLPKPAPILTAYTISVGEPEVMAAAARMASARELLKVKMAGEGDEERIAAVRAAAPHTRLIVDANEAWGDLDIERMAAALAVHRVELIEQPLPAGRDAELEHVRAAVPFCADESVHDLASLDSCLGHYDFINVKLDKSGGLTEALRLIEAARAAGIGIMTGCMLSTSLGIAPAFYAAMQGQFADLDGPLLLARDRQHALTFEGSDVLPPTAELWG